jgi:hypothetical protein
MTQSHDAFYVLGNQKRKKALSRETTQIAGAIVVGPLRVAAHNGVRRGAAAGVARSGEQGEVEKGACRGRSVAGLL